LAAALVAIVAVVGGGAGGYAIARSNGANLRKATRAGALEGRHDGHARGFAGGYRAGVRRGRLDAYHRTYSPEYRSSYRRILSEGASGP